ncbi:MAG: AraC family transcriptional regulator [Bacteroidota bacterium]
MTKAGKENFFKYLLDQQENDWGLVCKTTGYFHAPRDSDYPPPGHPKSHTFDWEHGRTLKGYYIIYIPTGSGFLETALEQVSLKAGDAMLIYHGEWHRYKPSQATGWEEYWVGFSGNYLEKYITEELFPNKHSYVKKVGYQSEIILLFNQLIELSKKEGALFKRVLLGCLLQIIAYFTAPSEEKIHTHRDSFLVEKTVEYIYQNLANNIDFQQLAQSFNLSYSRYRSVFKQATGLAPQQFLINERIECAKRLLRNTEMDIKEIAYKSGFQSAPYFSRIFQQKTGNSPSTERLRRV